MPKTKKKGIQLFDIACPIVYHKTMQILYGAVFVRGCILSRSQRGQAVAGILRPYAM